MSEVPLIALDPLAADHHGEAARMRRAGTVVRVLLPGGVVGGERSPSTRRWPNSSPIRG
ncbi:hypothetical protein [Saccharopolyspora mangrovi]|uniref:Uncharacterized protein n=1 Tax=Saccharopolyspora mangrovi TaxID=3082379 RepID=A0ABU6AKV4_9PSEU|nr:hypothetical protein [Saccharopolyspora sp. S2-29]MEB3372202.1 hypothetical protein [Saccharopolyspora sp. S2-29]